MMYLKPKNIIFDLGGVLFEQIRPSYNERIYKPLHSGISLLFECYEKKKDECKFFVCSNWTERALATIGREHGKVLQVFNGIVTPTMAQAKKPDPQIFEFLLYTYKLEAYECIFLDDQEANVKTAEFLGMKGILVNNFEHVSLQLKQLLSL